MLGRGQGISRQDESGLKVQSYRSGNTAVVEASTGEIRRAGGRNEENLPISKALAATDITLKATLVNAQAA